jgi:hypothetical protein
MKSKIAATLSSLVLLAGLASCGGGSSAQTQPSQPLQPPPPAGMTIGSVTPTSASTGSPDLPITVAGSNFDGMGIIRSRVVWSVNSVITPLATNFVDSTLLTAVIPANLLTSRVTAQVLVQNYDHVEGVVDATSNSVSFSVTAHLPTGDSVSPSSDTLGPKGMRQFVYAIGGQAAAANWTVEEGETGGTVTPGGMYVAPTTAGTYHLVATSVTDPSKSATATVAVVNSGFAPAGNMNSPRNGHTATFLNDGKVLIAGGLEEGAGNTIAELFDPVSGTFTTTGSMTTFRTAATATLLANGKVLIAGGLGLGTSSLPRLNSAELYDSSTGTFIVTGSMSVPRFQHTATLLDSGKVLIAGGTDRSGGGGAAVASAELYDPATGTFAIAGSMLTDRAQHSATLLANGEVLIVGGWNGHRADAPDDPPWDPLFGELFDPSSAGFKGSGSTSTTRFGHTATRLQDGRVLLLGGVPATQNLHAQPTNPAYAELYNPASGTFSAAGDFTELRTKYTATLLTGGLLLLVGGEQDSAVVASADLFDSSSNSSVPTGGLVTPRSGHTATRLSDGRVLVTGGIGSDGNSLASAEVYR